MKRNIISVILVFCLCAGLCPGALAAEFSLEDSVSVDRLVAHTMELYLALEGNYDSVTPKDSNALSIGFLQWHGAAALKLLKLICETAPEAAEAALGAALYQEVVQTPLWSGDAGGGWKNRVLDSDEAAAIRALISSDLGIACQNQYARELILEEARHGWDRGIRTEAALLYYCTVEHQYGVGGVSYFMEYVRATMGIGEDGIIRSLDEFHNGVLEAANSYSSIRNYLSGRIKVYNFIVNTLQLPAGPDTESATPFVDLPEPGHWARAAIEWAYLSDPQITGGSSETTFSPDDPVTRGEAVTFLWAAAGRPEPLSTTTVFQDVDGDAFYYTAVLWAAENRITCGTSETSFSPEDPVTRGEMLTFLWAAFGHGAPGSPDNPYSDLFPDQFYLTPILWAKTNNVLIGCEGGDDPDRICPTEPCTRAYVVSYLYRLFHRE